MTCHAGTAHHASHGQIPLRGGEPHGQGRPEEAGGRQLRGRCGSTSFVQGNVSTLNLVPYED